MQKISLKDKSQILIAILFVILIQQKSFSQIERETRAVWIAVNHHLDWPPQTNDAEKQKKALEEIFNNIKAKNLNTVYLQARFNGTVLFKSYFEPFTSYVAEKTNGEISYDPLEYAVELAHKKGLEIHAWVNCVNVFSGSETNILDNPNHIVKRKPEWIIEDNRDGTKSYWLDPGLPEVRAYIADVITEMVKNYDVDGVQLDYIRYPGKNFDDDFSYGVYGNDISRDDWRRNNITELIGLINKNIKAVKPSVKLGAAPIGIYKNLNGTYAWEGFSQVYQDSREWLKQGVLDYVTPQIYWGMDESPRFDLIAKDWVENSYGRNVVLGIGAYKENVKNEIGKMIQYSRSINASGVAFFRYSNIKDYDFKNFSNRTFPADMTWLDGSSPEAPLNLRYERDEFNLSNKQVGIRLIKLVWNNKDTHYSNNIRYFALYSLPHPGSELLPDYLFDLVPADKSSATLAIKPKKINYYFTMKSVGKLWKESAEPSNVVDVKFDELNSLVNIDEQNQNPLLVKNTDGSTKILLFSNIEDKIEVYGQDDLQQKELLTEAISVGKNIIDLPVDISKYKLLKIIYQSSKREVELKF